jgi:hypothetical protein
MWGNVPTERQTTMGGCGVGAAPRNLQHPPPPPPRNAKLEGGGGLMSSSVVLAGSDRFLYTYTIYTKSSHVALATKTYKEVAVQGVVVLLGLDGLSMGEHLPYTQREEKVGERYEPERQHGQTR